MTSLLVWRHKKLISLMRLERWSRAGYDMVSRNFKAMSHRLRYEIQSFSLHWIWSISPCLSSNSGLPSRLCTLCMCIGGSTAYGQNLGGPPQWQELSYCRDSRSLLHKLDFRFWVGYLSSTHFSGISKICRLRKVDSFGYIFFREHLILTCPQSCGIRWSKAK